MDDKLKTILLSIAVAAVVIVAIFMGMRAISGEQPQVQRGPELSKPGDKTADLGP